MSDGLYEAYEAFTKRPSFVNQDLGYLIAQEMRRSTDLTSVAQNVVENIKQLYRNTCKKTVSKGRLDDITLIVRNFTGLQHTVSYPSGISTMEHHSIHTAPVLPNTQQNQFFPGSYATMTSGQTYAPAQRYHAHTDIHRVASDSRMPQSSAGSGPQHGDPQWQSQPPWNQPTVSGAATTGGANYPPHWGQLTVNMASRDDTAVPVVVKPSYSHPEPPITTLATTPSQQPMRSRTDTHGYVNVSPATAITGTNATYSASGDPTLPANSATLQIPRKKDSGYVNVSPTSTTMGHKRYSDSQLDQHNIQDTAGDIPDRNAHTPPPMTDHDPSHHSVTSSVLKSPIPTPRRDLKPLNTQSKRTSLPKQSSEDRRASADDYDMYGWRADDSTPVSSQPSSMTRESENGPSTSGTLTGADFPSHSRIEEEAIDADIEGTEDDDDGNGMGIVSFDAEALMSDFSEASDIEEEEDPDGMIKSHVRFDTLKFNVNLSWDDI